MSTKPKRIVTFANTASIAPDPVETNDKLRFRDLRFKEAFREKTVRWNNGDNWVRILPPIQGSSYQWMMRLEVIQAPYGQGERLPTFCHPKNFENGARSPFDDAYDWYRKEAKEQLYNSEKNPNGVKLTSKSEGICWVIRTGAEPGEKLGLFCASLYDGSWGGGPGLAYRIWSEANQIDKEPDSPTFEQKVYGDITAPSAGNLVLIEKKKPENGDRYASYIVRIGKAQAPIEKYIDTLTDEEHELLVPLEKTLYIPTDEEQHNILREYIGAKNYKSIFGIGEALGVQHSKEEEQEDEVQPSTAVTEAKDEPEGEEELPTPDEKVTKAPEPKPEPANEAPVAKAKDTTTPSAERKQYGIREISLMIGTKEGVITLLENIKDLSANHRKVVLEIAKDLDIDLSEYPGATE